MTTESKKIMSVVDATNSLKKEKAIFIITDLNDCVNIQGYIYEVSKTKSTYKKLIEKYQQLGAQGVEAMLIGSYENGDAVVF